MLSIWVNLFPFLFNGCVMAPEAMSSYDMHSDDLGRARELVRYVLCEGHRQSPMDITGACVQGGGADAWATDGTGHDPRGRHPQGFIGAGGNEFIGDLHLSFGSPFCGLGWAKLELGGKKQGCAPAQGACVLPLILGPFSCGFSRSCGAREKAWFFPHLAAAALLTCAHNLPHCGAQLGKVIRVCKECLTLPGPDVIPDLHVHLPTVHGAHAFRDPALKLSPALVRCLGSSKLLPRFANELLGSVVRMNTLETLPQLFGHTRPCTCAV